MEGVPATYGAVLLGGFLAAAFSGILTTQAFVYMKLYPEDAIRIKSVVTAVWLLDNGHTGVVLAFIWMLLIPNFENTANVDIIPKPLPITIQLTAVLTFIVHCFYAQRIHKVSHRDWRITMPVLVFAFLRLGAATASAYQIVRLGTFSALQANMHIQPILVLGLALSCFVDILITVFLTYKLRNLRRSSTSLNHAINTVIWYTLETGFLTGAATIVSMILWLVMPNNFIFITVYFVVGKLYANSLLVILNSRHQLQQDRAQGGLVELPMAFFGDSTYSKSKFTGRDSHVMPLSFNLSHSDTVQQKVEITVERTVEYDVHTGLEEGLSICPRSPASSRNMGAMEIEGRSRSSATYDVLGIKG